MNLKFEHFVVLNIIDIVLTYYAITHMGLSEGNPILSPIFSKIGLLFGLVVIKIIGLIVIWYITKQFTPNIKKISLNIICLMFMFVVANNIYQILAYEPNYDIYLQCADIIRCTILPYIPAPM